MKVMVTGATGFVGRYVVAQLLENGHEVVAVARDAARAQALPWFGQVSFVACNLHDNFSALLMQDKLPDVLLHLAWPGLPNYSGFFHISENFPADLKFLHAMVAKGVPRVIVAGTCLEYGMQCGELTEISETKPTTPYGLAKDMLRKSLEQLQEQQPFNLQWIRLFYMYGEGQSPRSLLSQLDVAIDNNETVFNMSEGSQLRDYMPIESVAQYFSVAVDTPECSGVINCCSGKPISVLDLVMRHCEQRGETLNLNRGFYAYPTYEPMAFWGGRSKLAPYIV